MSKTVKFKLREDEIPFVLAACNYMQISPEQLAREMLFQACYQVHQRVNQATVGGEASGKATGPEVDTAVTGTELQSANVESKDSTTDPLVNAAWTLGTGAV